MLWLYERVYVTGVRMVDALPTTAPWRSRRTEELRGHQFRSKPRLANLMLILSFKWIFCFSLAAQPIKSVVWNSRQPIRLVLSILRRRSNYSLCSKKCYAKIEQSLHHSLASAQLIIISTDGIISFGNFSYIYLPCRTAILTGKTYNTNTFNFLKSFCKLSCNSHVSLRISNHVSIFSLLCFPNL